ncbi:MULTISPECIES: hypothetical protein [unclassified Variovorax]|uniref:hypothetical protein n=1 Tax=unclassified Variovorax TaxID=663243 RepID=UPI001BD697D0|nr:MULTISPECIES: hypothetical protein [unclassified Variovorax]
MGVLVSFDAQGNWGETHVCDSEIARCLAELGAAWRPRARRRARQQSDAALAKTRLLYLRAGDGFAGVLCEPGDWIEAKAGNAPAPGRDKPLGAWPDLPSLDTFIETMLELTGNESADDE